LDVNMPQPSGEARYEIKVPSGVHGYVALGIDQPAVGAKASVRVRVGDRVAAEDAFLLGRQL
jgi:hypothetical protein